MASALYKVYADHSLCALYHIFNVHVYLDIFMRMGLPSILTTDNGSEFRNKLNNAMMKQLGIRHCLITPYHPQVHKVYNFSSKFHISLFMSSQMVLKNDTIKLCRECSQKQ